MCASLARQMSNFTNQIGCQGRVHFSGCVEKAEILGGVHQAGINGQVGMASSQFLCLLTSVDGWAMVHGSMGDESEERLQVCGELALGRGEMLLVSRLVQMPRHQFASLLSVKAAGVSINYQLTTSQHEGFGLWLAPSSTALMQEPAATSPVQLLLTCHCYCHCYCHSHSLYQKR